MINNFASSVCRSKWDLQSKLPVLFWHSNNRCTMYTIRSLRFVITKKSWSKKVWKLALSVGTIFVNRKKWPLPVMVSLLCTILSHHLQIVQACLGLLKCVPNDQGQNLTEWICGLLLIGAKGEPNSVSCKSKHLFNCMYTLITTPIEKVGLWSYCRSAPQSKKKNSLYTYKT